MYCINRCDECRVCQARTVGIPILKFICNIGSSINRRHRIACIVWIVGIVLLPVYCVLCVLYVLCILCVLYVIFALYVLYAI